MSCIDHPSGKVQESASPLSSQLAHLCCEHHIYYKQITEVQLRKEAGKYFFSYLRFY